MDEQMKAYYDMINQQQQMNNAWSAEQAQKAMDYQERMSNTAHQREVADLKAAGLNPVLSAGGQGATTGTGHAAQAGNENVSALYGMISKVLDSQIAQANAMKASAKASAGYAGFAHASDKELQDVYGDLLKDYVNDSTSFYHSGDGFSGRSGNFSDVNEIPSNSGVTLGGLINALGLSIDEASAVISTIFHISKSTAKVVVERASKVPWQAVAGGGVAAALWKYGRKHPVNWDDFNKKDPPDPPSSGAVESTSGEVNGRNVKEVGETEARKKTPAEEKGKISKKNKREAATMVGLALAALIGKGLAGGSSKQLKQQKKENLLY